MLGLWCLLPLSTILHISWWSILLVEETGENHRHAASLWQILSHNVLSSNPRLNGIQTRNVSGDHVEIRNEFNLKYFLYFFLQTAPVSNSSYQSSSTSYVPAKSAETVKPPPSTSNGGVDFTKLSAKEMRAVVASKKKKDPRKETTDFRRKFDEFNRLWTNTINK